ncbi:hypothetical protein ACIHDR_31840 [Nocardia sp. NPDC052278]|uniref:hypothetical protein n=1 Tax=unclassified Nocardia TaxID=2637762 RepID=UPI0036C55BDD
MTTLPHTAEYTPAAATVDPITRPGPPHQVTVRTGTSAASGRERSAPAVGSDVPGLPHCDVKPLRVV